MVGINPLGQEIEDDSAFGAGVFVNRHNYINGGESNFCVMFCAVRFNIRRNPFRVQARFRSNPG
jgi:hypothetical protein